ncbi:MAG: hypothetical protein F7B20_04450 [Aeropyrum sp.]|nr:hypothetical protein [Aeropyrum sp.]
MERKVVEARPIPHQMAKKYVGERVREGDAISIQESTWEYFKRVVSWDDPEGALKLYEELVSEGLSPEAAANVASLCPKDEGELRAVLAVDRNITSTYEAVNKYYPIVSKYCSAD